LAKSHLKASVLLISGTHQLSEFDLPAGVDCLTLPGITKSICGTYASRQYNLSLQSVIRLRSQIIKAAVEAFEPDIFIADNVPRGVKCELDPVLTFLSFEPEIVSILGIRDILDAPERIRDEWQKKQNEDIIQRFYDAVWVYGDRDFYDSSQEYSFSEQLNNKLSFTGYLNPLCRHKVSPKSYEQQKKTKKQKLPDSFHLCMAGGGQDGIALTQAFADALADSEDNGVILTGPFIPDKAFKKLKKRVKGLENIKLIKFYHEPINLIKLADKVVSMGGYNSVSEILALKKNALIIPRVEPRQEQWIRADKLSDWGLIDVMHPKNLNAGAIKLWLETGLENHPKTKTLDFDGLNRIVANIAGYFENKHKINQLLKAPIDKCKKNKQ
jgi:predicted glycosyltransferase